MRHFKKKYFVKELAELHANSRTVLVNTNKDFYNKTFVENLT